MKIKALKENDIFYKDLESRIDSIKAKKNKYTILYKTTKIIVFMAGASITILTGWKMYCDCKFNVENAVLVISSGVTLLAALEGLFAFKEKGQGYDIFLFDLRRLRDRICYEYMKSPILYQRNRDKHFDDYQKILESQKAIIENSNAGED